MQSDTIKQRRGAIRFAPAHLNVISHYGGIKPTMIISELGDPDVFERSEMQARYDVAKLQLLRNRLGSYLADVESGNQIETKPFSRELVADLLAMVERCRELENHRVRQLEVETYQIESELQQRRGEAQINDYYRDCVAELMLLMSKAELCEEPSV